MLSHVWLCDSVDCSLSASSIHGILQARIVEWVAISFSRGSSRLRDRILISCTGRQILYWRATWKALTTKPGMLQSMGLLRVGHTWSTSLSCIGEGNGNPLHYSCLENPRDGGAWWAAVYGVAQSRTRLMWYSSSSSTVKSSTYKQRIISKFW